MPEKKARFGGLFFLFSGIDHSAALGQKQHRDGQAGKSTLTRVFHDRQTTGGHILASWASSVSRRWACSIVGISLRLRLPGAPRWVSENSREKLFERRFITGFAFPNHFYVPARPLKSLGLLAIALDVPIQLFLPVFLSRMRPGGAIASWVLMPETTMYKHGDGARGKHEVGRAWHSTYVESVSQPSVV